MSISMNSQSALHEVESRCTQERPPRCQSLCPLGLDARAFLGHAAEARACIKKAASDPELRARAATEPDFKRIMQPAGNATTTNE